jgi:mannose-6-phosphate isomerase-like protein (cupin superfamily)
MAEAKRKIVFELGGTYVQLKDNGSAAPVEAGPDFWTRFAGQPELAEGRLVWAAAQVRDWANWERNPNGDALYYLLSGAVDMMVEVGESEHTISLRPNNACIVPRGVWHRLIVQKPANLLAVTKSAGKEQRPVEQKKQPEQKR